MTRGFEPNADIESALKFERCMVVQVVAFDRICITISLYSDQFGRKIHRTTAIQV